VRDQGLFVPLSLPFFGRRDDFVGQVGRGALWVRRIVNPPAGSEHNAGESPEEFAACRYAGQAILPVAMTHWATKGDENPAFLGLSTNLRKAGQGPSRGPGGPLHFDRAFDRAAAFSSAAEPRGSSGQARVFVLSQRRLKAGGSQDWLPHSLL
jgi:hypothetical protein